MDTGGERNSLIAASGENGSKPRAVAEKAKAFLKAAENETDATKIKPQDKTIEMQMTGLEQSKDRAQVTASTSMSIVSVALLKNIIEVGSSDNRYYYWSLSFIIAALILQVFAGLLALYISLLKYYQSTYKDDFVEDCGQLCCPYKCRKNTPKEVKSIEDFQNNTKSSKDVEQGCCPYKCVAMRYDDFEYELVEIHENHLQEIIRSELNAVNYEEEIKWCNSRLDLLQKEMDVYGSMNPTDSETAEKLKELKREIEHVMHKMQHTEKLKSSASMERSRGALLAQYVHEIQEKHVLKRVTIVQNLLNLVLYAVFVLNILITGIGLATPQMTSSASIPSPVANISSV